MDKKDIKKLRQSLKLTQSKFAAKLKVDVLTVSRWERGENRPTRTPLKRLSRLARKVKK